MGREKALAFVGICTIAVVFLLKNFSVLHSFTQHSRQRDRQVRRALFVAE